jgi:hypothetical protein
MPAVVRLTSWRLAVIDKRQMPFFPEHFERGHPGRPLPDIRTLSNEDREQLHMQMRLSLGDFESDPAMRTPWLLFDAWILDGNAEADQFDLKQVWGESGLPTPVRVFVDWFGGRILELPFDELTAYFDCFWYPSSDDIAIFDSSFDWFLFVTHEGELRLIRDAGFHQSGRGMA